jgi:hypothetical protein
MRIQAQSAVLLFVQVVVNLQGSGSEFSRVEVVRGGGAQNRAEDAKAAATSISGPARTPSTQPSGEVLDFSHRATYDRPDAEWEKHQMAAVVGILFGGARATIALTSTFLLLGCGQPQAAAPSVDLGRINPAATTDPLPILFDPLRAELVRSFPPGTDLAPGYASLDQLFRPALADAEAAVQAAPDQYLGANGKPVVGTPSPAAERHGGVVLLATDPPGSGVVFLVDKKFDSGPQEAPGGWTVDVTGVSQLSADDVAVIYHVDATGDSTQSRPPTTDLVDIRETLAVEVKVETCPDAAGLIHGTVKLKLGEDVQRKDQGGRSRGERHYVVSGDIVGHVNDSAELTAYDLLHLSFQRVGTEVGATDAGAFLATGYSYTGIDPAVAAGNMTGHLGAEASATVHSTRMNTADITKEISALILTARHDAQPAMITAERGWQGGKCVELMATKGPDPKRVKPGGTTKFTVEVRHKPDGAPLSQNIVPIPHGGNVVPAGTRVPSPAQFTFRADGGKPKPYGVELKSTSRRGIGELSLSFSQAYMLKITFVSGPSARGLPSTVPVTVTGTIQPDASGTSLSGTGTFQAEGYTGQCGAWSDAGPITLSVPLQATDKGDGNFELTIQTVSDYQLPPVVFPASGGTATSTGTFKDCGSRSGTATVEAELLP